MQIHGDHKMTAAITVSKRHDGELPSRPADPIDDLKNKAHAARRAAHRWAHVSASLITARNSLRDVDADRSLHIARNDQSAVLLMKEAAKALGPYIAQAINAEKAADKEAADADQEVIAIIDARRKANPMPGMTNIEMDQFLRRDRDERTARIAKDGCCGETPNDQGICFGIGPCPRAKEISACVGFCKRLIAWADSISESQSDPVSSQENVA